MKHRAIPGPIAEKGGMPAQRRHLRPQAFRRQMGTQPALSPTPLHQLGTVELHSEGIAG